MKVKEKEGHFLKVSINDGYHSYARKMAGVTYAFYDCKTNSELPLTEIAKLPILFIIPVHHRFLKSGKWEIIGELDLEEHLKIEPAFFMQDILNPKLLSVYKGGNQIPASYEECKNLERAAVWDPDGVESRLNDYYAGRPNFWVEQMKIKPTE